MQTMTTKDMRPPFRKLLNQLGMSPFGLICLTGFALLPLFCKEYLIRWFVVGLFTATQAVAFDFTSGSINIINFGFAAFVGVGAYTSAILATRFGISPWLGMFIGIIPSALLGFFTGILTLRLRGIFAAVMAWFIGLALMGLATKMVWLTQGPLGLNCPTLLKTSSNLPYFYIALAMLLIAYITLGWVVRSNTGLAFKAIGQNMEAARTSGVNPFRYRIMNFTLSCAFAGWVGGFYAHYYGVLMPDVMKTAKTVEILVIVYLGGRATLWGGIAASILFVYALETLQSSLSSYPGLSLIFYGLFLILCMQFFPGGIARLYTNLSMRLNAHRRVAAQPFFQTSPQQDNALPENEIN